MKPEIVGSNENPAEKKDYSTDLPDLVKNIDEKIDILLDKDNEITRAGIIRKMQNIVEEFKKHGITEYGVHPYFQMNKKAMLILKILAKNGNDYEAAVDELKRIEEQRLIKEFRDLNKK